MRAPLLMGALLLGWLAYISAPTPLDARQACTTTLSTGANVPAAVSSAAANAVICLNSGNYGSVSFTNISRTSFVTVRSTTGVGAVMSPGVSNSDFIKLQSLTLSSAGVSACSTNIHILDSTFAPNVQHLSLDNFGDGCSGNMAWRIYGNTFADGQATTQEGRVSVGAVDGLMLANNEFTGEPASGAGSDGIQLWASAANIRVGPGNHFHDIDQGECDALGDAHCDPIQIYMGASAGTNIVIDGNYFHDNTATLQNANCDPACPTVTFTNNVIDTQDTLFVSAPNVVFSHNTVYSLGTFDLHWSGASTNTTMRSNIILLSDDPNAATGTWTHNLCSSAPICLGTDQTIGTPTFDGGAAASISTFVGWKLSVGSIGKGTAHDGKDRGVDFTAIETTAPAPSAPTNVRIGT